MIKNNDCFTVNSKKNLWQSLIKCVRVRLIFTLIRRLNQAVSNANCHICFMSIADIYIKSSLHVSLAVVSFAIITGLELGIILPLSVLFFIFFSTVVSYNVTKYGWVFIQSLSGRKARLNQILGITTLSAAGLAATAFMLSIPELLLAILLSILTASYALPLPGDQINLRNRFGMKIFIIALVWTGATVWLPILTAARGTLIISDVAILSVQRFLFVVVLTLPFDIRDLSNDHPTLGTVPQLIGVKKTRLLGVILLTICVLLGLIIHSPSGEAFIILAIISILTGVLILRSMTSQSRWFASFWVEGVPILWALLLSGASIFLQ